jgi:hypothetical protein
MTALASSEKDTLASFITIPQVETPDWDRLYKLDKQFALYRLDYHDWRYTIYGDDLSKVTSELALKWLRLSGDKEADTHKQEFQKLAEYLEREGLLQ